MPHVKVDFFVDVPGDVNWRLEPAEAGFDDLMALWRRKVFAPYLERFIDEYGGVPRRMELSLPVCDEPNSLTFIFDQGFLLQALEAYAVHGWSALEALAEKVAQVQAPETRAFVGATSWVVSVCIGRELVRIENELGDLARSEWRVARDRLGGFLAEFEPIGKGSYKYRNQFRDRSKGKQVFSLCADYARELRAFERYRGSLDDRNAKDQYDPAATLERTPAQQTWAELYARPQREVMKRMSVIIQRLAVVFPAAVLVLAELPADIAMPIASDVGAEYWERARPLDDRIYDNLAQLSAQLATLEASLLKPGQTEKLKPYLARPRPLPPGGLEAMLLDAAWEGSPEDNRVMADAGLVERLLLQVEAQRPVSWERAVLMQYHLYLRAQLDEKARDQARWDQVWGWVGRVTAALSLLTLLAFVPFGSGAAAVAAPIVTALSIVGGAALALTVVMLLHDLWDLFAEARQAEATGLREKMYELGQADPEALSEVAAILRRNHQLRDALTTGLLTTLFQMALARKIKVLALALDLDGSLDDIEILFATPVARP